MAFKIRVLLTIVGKGENASYQPVFTPFPTTFSKEKLYPFPKVFLKTFFFLRVVLTLYHTIPTFNGPKEEGFGNTVGIGENAGNQHFLHFTQCFLPYERETIIVTISNLSSANTFNFDQAKLFTKRQIFNWTKFKAFVDDILNVAKIMISVLGKKKLWEKEKILVTSIFSFSHNAFKSFLFQGR